MYCKFMYAALNDHEGNFTHSQPAIKLLYVDSVRRSSPIQTHGRNTRVCGVPTSTSSTQTLEPD